ncbi:MAG: queuosine precursor transporter [Phycisphaerales bacterium]|nr:queuosine precursor transporter [Phycisphaerales bacterium]
MPPEPNPNAAERMPFRDVVYLWLAGVFVTSLLVANLVGSKFFWFGDLPVLGRSIPIEHSVGMFAFPVTFLLTDLVNEYYGKKGARRITWLGLGMSLYVYAMLWLAREAPPAPPGRTYIDEQMFDAVFGASRWLIVASLTAYTAGQLCDIFLFGVIRRLTGGRMIWLRATGSTVVSQFVDSLVISFVLMSVQPLADGSRASFAFMLETAVKGYVLKAAVAVAVTPLIYLGHAILKGWLGLRPAARDEPAAAR